jgi:Leucine-rich repeat (LRR) protein
LADDVNLVLGLDITLEPTMSDLEKVTKLSGNNQNPGGMPRSTNDTAGFLSTDKCLKGLGYLKNLTELNLRISAITYMGIREVGKLEHLVRLNLQATKITDAGLKELVKCKKLTWLDLGDTQITDAGLKELAKCKQLTHLDLQSTKITDAGLKELAKCKQLTSLNLEQTKVTKAGVDQLESMLGFRQIGGVRLPNCTIKHDAVQWRRDF